jgi:hypothetical protein
MKNIFKSRFSLIAICIVLGILIGSFALCGCRTSYSLIEGLEPNSVPVSAPVSAPVPASLPASIAPLPVPAPVGGATKANGAPVELEKVGDDIKSNSNAFINAFAQAKETFNPLAELGVNIIPDTGKLNDDDEDTSEKKKEPFQMSRPLAWRPIKDDKSDDLHLSKWVSDAMRYSKGMGNDNHLSSYEYNTGPAIPLPEGELFFFKDTKFDTSCCPSTYTNSKGCACMSKKQFQHLIMRGGNNTIPDTKTSYYNEY